MEISIKIDNSNNQQIKSINLDFYENGDIIKPVNENKVINTGRSFNNISSINNSLVSNDVELPDTTIKDRDNLIVDEMNEDF